MRRGSGDTRRRGCGGAGSARGAASLRPLLPGGLPRAAPARRGASGAVAAGCAAVTVAVAISDAIERLDLGEFAVDDLELLAEPVDVAVDRTVIDIDVLAIGGVHQLVAAFDMALARRQRFQDEELGDRELDRLAAPGAQMAPGIEQEIAALDHRLAVAWNLAARQ